MSRVHNVCSVRDIGNKAIQSCNCEGQILACVASVSSRVILFNSARKQVETITPLSLLVISSIYFFYSKSLFAKKKGEGVIVVIGVLHGMEVKCQLLRRKFVFSFLFDACRRAVWHEGEVQLNASDK